MADYLDMGQAVALIKSLGKAFVTAEAGAAQSAADSAAAAAAAAASVQNPVSYGTAQQLTAAQQATARGNIGVDLASAAETTTYVIGA